MEEKEKQTIKDLYKDMIEISKVNNPDYYWMSITFYNSIIKRIIAFERALKNARKSNEKLTAKLKELKK